MADFFRNFEAFSFWIGVVTGFLIIYLLGKLRHYLNQISDNWKKQLEKSKQEKLHNDSVKIGNDTLIRCQGMHLAASLFSLDEILIPPRLLAPPTLPMAYHPEPYEDITDWVIPYTLDSPELASFYNSPSITCAEALQGDANILIVAEPGQGKSTCLAHLAAQFIRGDQALGELANKIPLLLHIADLNLPAEDSITPFEIIINAITPYIKSIPNKRLPNALQIALSQNDAILLLDGLDEASPEEMDIAIDFLNKLSFQYPKLRMVASASPYHLAGLLNLGFYPLALKCWTPIERQQFIETWGTLWHRHIAEPTPDEESDKISLLVAGWLSNQISNLTPFELTLNLWAAFAGDTSGNERIDYIEAYIQRVLFDQDSNNRLGLQELALQMALNPRSFLPRNRTEKFLSGSNFPEMLQSGMITLYPNENVKFTHIILNAYLASQQINLSTEILTIISQSDWACKRETLHYLSAQDQSADWLRDNLKPIEVDPTLHELRGCARWLRDAPIKSTWAPEIMRRLAKTIQNKNVPLSLKTRALTAFIFTGKREIAILMRQWLQSDDPILQQIACLGCGVIQDKKSIETIDAFINHQFPSLMRSAILALIAIGTPKSMELVAYHLLNGSESIQRAAAEGLSNNIEEGYPTLEEGSQMDDPNIRRAVVFGLGRIHETWSLDILKKLQTNDPQWIVQDAAFQAIQLMTEKHPRTPHAHPDLTMTAWLIEFAGERGMGVTPGKASIDLVYNALFNGNEDQRLAALYYLSLHSDESALLPILKTFMNSSGDLRESAFENLVRLKNKGIDIPPPN